LFVIGFGERGACEVEGGGSSLWYVFGVVIFGLGVLQMIFLIVGVVMVVVLEGVDFIGLSLGDLPYLVRSLQLLPLLGGGVRTLGVTLEAAVTDHFVYHFISNYRSYIKRETSIPISTNRRFQSSKLS
jgi:hypothetical protein